MDLGLDVREVAERRAVLAVSGRLNAVTVPVLKARIKELVGLGRVELVCDLTGVGFLDSSGLAALVTGLKAVRERDGFLRLSGMNEQVAKIFKLTMLDRVFDVYPNSEAALA